MKNIISLYTIKAFLYSFTPIRISYQCPTRLFLKLSFTLTWLLKMNRFASKCDIKTDFKSVLLPQWQKYICFYLEIFVKLKPEIAWIDNTQWRKKEIDIC